MSDKKATITDVADQASVSKATVSAVINSKGTVKDSTRRRVLRAIEALNYRPNGSARRRFRTDMVRSVGIVIKEADNPYYAGVIEGARDLAADKNYTLLSASSEGSFEAEKRIVDMLTAKDVDGLIVTPVLDEHADLSHIFELKRHNVPFVLLEEVRGVNANLVDIDNVGASRDAVAYLINQGHKRIAHFAGPLYSMHSEERIQGMQQAYSQSHLIFHDDLVINTGAHLQDGYQKGLEYFNGLAVEQRPTAVTCYNDLVAVGLLRALHELGIRVPEDVSIIGCDDLEIAQYVSPSLSSIRIPKFEMGRYAIEILVRQMETSEAQSPTKQYLNAELMLRGSTAS